MAILQIYEIINFFFFFLIFSYFIHAKTKFNSYKPILIYYIVIGNSLTIKLSEELQESIHLLTLVMNGQPRKVT